MPEMFTLLQVGGVGAGVVGALVGAGVFPVRTNGAVGALDGITVGRAVGFVVGEGDGAMLGVEVGFVVAIPTPSSIASISVNLSSFIFCVLLLLLSVSSNWRLKSSIIHHPSSGIPVFCCEPMQLRKISIGYIAW
jgi:hypothetical protein